MLRRPVLAAVQLARETGMERTLDSRMVLVVGAKLWRSRAWSDIDIGVARADTPEEALAAARARAPVFVAAIVAASESPTAGVSLGQGLRRIVPRLQVLLVGASEDGRVANDALAAGFAYAVMPIGHPELSTFLRTARARHPERRIARAMAKLSELHGLTDGEEYLLRLAVTGTPRADLGHVAQIAENSVKSRVRSILSKTRTDSLPDSVRLVLMEALHYT